MRWIPQITLLRKLVNGDDHVSHNQKCIHMFGQLHSNVAVALQMTASETPLEYKIPSSNPRVEYDCERKVLI